MPVLPLPLFHLFPAQAEAVSVRRGGSQPSAKPRPYPFESDFAALVQHRIRIAREDEELVAVL